MKGDLHTEELMHAVVASQTGLRTARHISHAYLMDIPDYPRPLLLTDVAINIAPTLMEKVSIVQNAIDFAHVMGIAEPRVAILAAVETVSDRLPSTLDAAALCKMAERGQITGGLLDGPLGFDNAINEAAAVEKALSRKLLGGQTFSCSRSRSRQHAGQAAHLPLRAEAAGVVLGARVPIILSSRADSANTRLASCALGVLMARAGRTV